MADQYNETEHFKLTWQQQLSEAFKSVDDLCRYLELSIDELPVSVAAADNFAFKVPLSFASSMEKGNPVDPLLKQVLPVHEEMIEYLGYNNNPVGDLEAVVIDGVLHKYHGRVLLINTGSCAINCRYCFRRNFPYTELQLSKQKQNLIFDYIKDNSISEVILSGGDPLLLSDNRLADLIQQLGDIQHVKRIRIHSRLPIVLPARITNDIVKIFTRSRAKIVFVVHCNHANEINERVASGFRDLASNGIAMFNQSVLLKDVNDEANVLVDLSEQLFAHGVVPYYLHLLDKASGTGHFEVSEAKALELIQQVQKTLPGYLVPKLVRERPGGLYKEQLGFNFE